MGEHRTPDPEDDDGVGVVRSRPQPFARPRLLHLEPSRSGGNARPERGTRPVHLRHGKHDAPEQGDRFEASRFANADNTTNAQYVVQPYTTEGNLRRISIPTAAITKVTLTWTPGRVAYSGETVRGGKTEPLRSCSNTSSSVPDHGGEQVHMSLWLFRGAPPSNGKPVTVTVTGFAFSPVT